MQTQSQTHTLCSRWPTYTWGDVKFAGFEAQVTDAQLANARKDPYWNRDFWLKTESPFEEQATKPADTTVNGEGDQKPAPATTPAADAANASAKPEQRKRS